MSGALSTPADALETLGSNTDFDPLGGIDDDDYTED